MNCLEGDGFRQNTGLHIAMVLQIILSLFSIVANAFLLIMSKRYVFFHPNFKVLVMTNLIANIGHSLTNIVTQGYHLVRLISAESSCDLMIPQTTCLFFRFPSIVCISFFVYLHGCMIAERFIAARQRDRYEASGYKLSIYMVIAGIVIVTLLTAARFRNYPSEEFTAVCIAVTNSTYFSMMWGCATLACLESIFFATYVSLRYINKNALSNTVYTLTQRFQLKENILVLKLLGPLFSLTFIMLVMFALLCVLIFGYFSTTLTSNQILAVHGFAYIIPYYTLLCPTLIWIILTKYEKETRQAIASQLHLSKRNERVMYFDTYNKLWR